MHRRAFAPFFRVEPGSTYDHVKLLKTTVFSRATSALLLVLATVLTTGCETTPQDEYAGISPDKLYADAKEDQTDGNYDTAIKKFEKVEARASGTLLAQQAQLDLAYTYYKTDDKPQALAKLDRFIRLHPTSPALDYAYYLQGLINFNDDLGFFGRLARQDLAERDQQASRDAYDAFKQLIDRFPNSKYAPDARLRMNYVVNSLAEGEVSVARYYLRRGAYVAAANRAQQAVKEYRQSPAIEEALAIMVKSYTKLGLTDLADDAQRVLKQSFPNSKALEQ